VPSTVLQRVARGEPDAFEECLATYGALVWRLVRRHTASQTDAEDAVQDVFVALWRAAGRFDPALSPESAFVTLVARRRLIDRRRRSRARPAVGPSLEELAEPPSVSPDLAPDQRDEAARVLAAVDALEGRERRLLRLSLHHGLSHSEIAAREELPLGTVKSTLRRALQAVRYRVGALVRGSTVTP
jgi:RNA polymerase sigma factor (sigma-70 family)